MGTAFNNSLKENKVSKNGPKDMKDLYTKKYKSLKKKIKDQCVLKKGGNISHASRLVELLL